MRSSLPAIGLASLAFLATFLPVSSAAGPAVNAEFIAAANAQYARLPKNAGLQQYLLSRIEEDPGTSAPGFTEESFTSYAARHKQGIGKREEAAPGVTAEVERKPAPTAVLGKRQTSSTFAAPAVVTTSLLGAAVNNPSKYYFGGLKSEALPTLSSDLLTVNLSVIPPLAEDYPQYNGSGSVTLNSGNAGSLTLLTTVPWLSRDAGRGGNLNGTKMFIFSDTETFTEPANESATDFFTGFVSNSVAVDLGFAAADGQPPVIRDKVGEWTNNNGGMRGWIPFTTGEKQYNYKMNNKGGRIAIWPSSAITLLTEDSAVQYASMVFVNTSGGASFHYVGTTMYTITVPNARSGPVADRVAPLLFPASGFEWGSTGATRSWGADGYGGSEGWIWIWANNGAGLWAGRAPAAKAADFDAYEYYWSSTDEWNSTAPTWGASSADVTISGSYSASDIFYSPRHKTFINVYADRYIDNQILWRYLVVDEPIEPDYDGTDFNLNMIKYPWSSTKTLVHCPVPGNGHYVYAQGTSPGYFDEDDITNGGDLMLLTWTAPTGEGSNTYDTQYELQTAVVQWS